MKTIAKGTLTTLFLILTISITYGQKGYVDGSRFGHGADSIECVKNFSIYRSNARQKNYDAITVNAWKKVYTDCPKASQYVYVDGIKMIEKAIQEENDPAKKEVLIDSMLRIYDKRIKYYNKKGYILGKKGVDFIQYSEKTVENMQKGYDFLKESISIEKYESGAPELLTFMQASNSLFRADAIESGVVVNDFSMVMEIIEHVIEKGDARAKANMERAKPSIEQIFEGIANCDDLIPYYATKFEETPNDLEFIKKASDLLKSTKCTDSDLYFNLTVKLNKLEPNADLAYELAKRMNIANKLEEASVYYLQAIELQEDNTEKAKYYLELGDLTRRMGDYVKARSYALKSIEFDATSGYPYLLIGNVYAASSKTCSEKEFEQKAVYWAAVDKFIKAKTVDPQLADDANKFIDAYRLHFPDGETNFMYGYSEGDAYTVGCWINETTTVRAR